MQLRIFKICAKTKVPQIKIALLYFIGSRDINCAIAAPSLVKVSAISKNKISPTIMINMK